MLLAYIPAPPGSEVGVGPLKLHVYGALIVCGVLAAVWLADRRWRAWGGEAGVISAVAMWGVPGGLIGARIYSVVTDYELYIHHPVNALKIWQGGLGIWGGIAGGVFTGWLYIRRHNLDFPALLDCVAPALPLAQAIGRWGNYFNQELFGRPTTLPWGLKVDASVVQSTLGTQHGVPASWLHAAAYQPTFLYECLWDLAVVGLVLLIEKRVRLRKGYLFWVYAALYTFGRFFTEYLRIDFAHKILGLRLNDWTSIIVFAAAMTILLIHGRVREGEATAGGAVDDPVLERPRVVVAVGQAGSTLSTTDLKEEIGPLTEDEPSEVDIEDKAGTVTPEPETDLPRTDMAEPEFWAPIEPDEPANPELAGQADPAANLEVPDPVPPDPDLDLAEPAPAEPAGLDRDLAQVAQAPANLDLPEPAPAASASAAAPDLDPTDRDLAWPAPPEAAPAPTDRDLAWAAPPEAAPAPADLDPPDRDLAWPAPPEAAPAPADLDPTPPDPTPPAPADGATEPAAADPTTSPTGPELGPSD